MKFVDVKNDIAFKHTWTKEELDAYDYAAMREQDERGKMIRKMKEVAVRLLKMGLPATQIAEATELTEEEVRAIAADIEP